MHRVKFNDYAELLSDDLNNNNAYLYNGLITAISDFIAANDCVSGLEVTAQAVPDMTVYVKSGRIYQNGYQGLLEADLTTPLTIAPASSNQPRIDLICAKYEEVEDEPEIRNVMTDVVSRNVSQVEVKTRIASSIAFQVVGGTAAAEPTVPTTPEGWVALAKVTVPANTSVIQQSNIVDMRPEIINIYQHDHSGGANGAKLDYNNLNNLPDLSDFTGATAEAAGKRGMVPAPAAGDQNKALFGNKSYKSVVQSINGVVADNEGDVSLRNALYCHDASEFMEELGTAGWNSKGVYAVTFANTDNFPQKPSPYCVVFNLAETPNNGYAIQIAVNILNGDIYVRGTNNQKEIDDVPFEKLVRNNELLAMLPIGTILPFAGGTIPYGFLATNGAAISRTTYSALFSAIGTTYGSGDGSTTFNLPLIEDNRFLEFASTAGTKKNAGLPNITGTFRYDVYATDRTGAFSTGSANDFRTGTSQTGTIGQDIQTVFDASDSNSIYGGSTTVQPKSLTVRAIIKY